MVCDNVDESFYEPTPPRRPSENSVRSELGLPNDVKIVLCVGRLLPRKRIDELIWTADLLKVVRGDIHLVIIGDGPDRERLVQFRNQIQIRDHVWLIGPRYDIARWMREAECLWTASDLEDSPLVVRESQAVGLPVIASDIAAHRRAVYSGRTGLLVPVGDTAVRARETLRILGDKGFADNLTREAKLPRTPCPAEGDSREYGGSADQAMNYQQLYESIA
jgi:glycosyltransferase involved in cell wall biosynthesis